MDISHEIISAHAQTDTFHPPTRNWLGWWPPDTVISHQHAAGAKNKLGPKTSQAPTGPKFALLYKLFIN